MMSTPVIRLLARIAVVLVVATSAYRAEAQWSKITDPYAGVASTEYHAIAVSATGDVYLAGNNTLYRSSDHGNTWKLLTTGLPTGQPVMSIGFNSLNEPVVGVGNFPNGGGTAYAYLYRNNTWQKAAGMTGSLRISAFIQDRFNRLVAVTGWHADVFRSSDNGLNYTQLAQAVGGSGTISAGALWTVARAPDGSLYAGGELANGIYKSTNDGAMWTQFGLASANGYKGNLNVIAFNKLGEPFANRQYNGSGLQRYSGGKWVSSTGGIPNYYWVMGVALNPVSGVMYSISYNPSKALGTIYQSTDDGKNWKQFNSGVPGDGFLRLVVSPDGYLYTINNGGGLFRTTVPVP